MGGNNISGIILAGGKSERMGQDKGHMLLNGRPMVAHVLEVLYPLCKDIIIVSNNKAYEAQGVPVYEDEFKDKGPLVGIYTGLLHSENDHNIVVSCDVPFLSGELLQHLIEESKGFDVTIPRHAGGTEQLMGIYTKNCLPIFKECIEASQLKIKEANKLTNYQEVLIDGHLSFYAPGIFINVNSQEDFQKAERA